MNQSPIVISLGGSMIVPDQPNISFLKKFKSLVQQLVIQGRRVCVVAGGGVTARTYIQALDQVKDTPSSEERDWMGIYATHMNAHLVRFMLQEVGETQWITDPSNFTDSTAPILITGGWKPGWSTDYPAVMLAHALGADTVVNVSNIDYVYDSDPRTNPSAKSFETISWDHYLTLIPETFTAGLSAPFDPVASRLAQQKNMKVIIMNGSGLENLEKFIKGETFQGTTIA